MGAITISLKKDFVKKRSTSEKRLAGPERAMGWPPRQGGWIGLVVPDEKIMVF